jgi:sporulation protein YlmC with PRC-barrel domain
VELEKKRSEKKRKEERIMLREVKELHGSTIHALDGEVGRVDEILFDDEHWTIRYLIVHTGSWLFGRKVLISPMAFGQSNWERQMLSVNLTRAQIENSPGVDTDEPVSRQWETDYYDYYGWPYYWGGMGGMGYMGGMGAWGTYWYPGALLAHPSSNIGMQEQQADDGARVHGDAHLRSTKEVTGYGIAATDGHLGHIDDFIINDETWRIRYLVVATRNWWPGKHVLLPPDWTGDVNWADRNVTVNVTREQVRNAPEWYLGQPITHSFEDQLYGYYARQRPQDGEQPRHELVEHAT